MSILSGDPLTQLSFSVYENKCSRTLLRCIRKGALCALISEPRHQCDIPGENFAEVHRPICALRR